MIEFQNPIGIIDDVQLHPHTLLPDRFVLRVSWTNKQMELEEGHPKLLEYSGEHPESQILLLDEDDLASLIRILNTAPLQ